MEYAHRIWVANEFFLQLLLIISKCQYLQIVLQRCKISPWSLNFIGVSQSILTKGVCNGYIHGTNLKDIEYLVNSTLVAILWTC